MKEIYSTPETEIVIFDAEDIITESLFTNPELPAASEPKQ